MKDNFLANVFSWMFGGLLATFVSSYFVITTPVVQEFIFSSNWVILVLFILQIVLCIYFSTRLTKLSTGTVTFIYFLYAILTGFTLSSIFFIYEVSSIIYVFLATSLVFFIFSLIGKKTKIDLSKIGTILLMLLLVVIVLEVVNIFILNSTLSHVLVVVSAVIFMGFIAYDIQQISRMEFEDEDRDKYAIYGAFQLYLDFINLFLDLLRLFGKTKD